MSATDIPTGGAMISATLTVVDDSGRALGTCRAMVGRVTEPPHRAGVWATNGHAWAYVTEAGSELRIAVHPKFPPVRK